MEKQLTFRVEYGSGQAEDIQASTFSAEPRGDSMIVTFVDEYQRPIHLRIGVLRVTQKASD